MKRRDALKNIGLTTGFVIATPGLISLLQSCKSEAATWKAVHLTEEQGVVLQKVVDVILPKTEDLPAASELNVPEFIDLFYGNAMDDEDQLQVNEAFDVMIAQLKTDYNEDLSLLTEENIKDYLDKNMRIKGEDDEERLANPESKSMTKSEFLNSMKWMTITAYVTTEKIGETVLAYDPIPTAYYCGDLEELTGGKSWSLGWP